MAVSINCIEEALFELEDCISLPEAEALLKTQGFKISKVSMIAWIRKYPIGMKVGGRWYVNPKALSLLLAGKISARYKPLEKKVKGVFRG